MQLAGMGSVMERMAGMGEAGRGPTRPEAFQDEGGGEVSGQAPEASDSEG